MWPPPVPLPEDRWCRRSEGVGSNRGMQAALLPSFGGGLHLPEPQKPSCRGVMPPTCGLGGGLRGERRKRRRRGAPDSDMEELSPKILWVLNWGGPQKGWLGPLPATSPNSRHQEGLPDPKPSLNGTQGSRGGPLALTGNLGPWYTPRSQIGGSPSPFPKLPFTISSTPRCRPDAIPSRVRCRPDSPPPAVSTYCGWAHLPRGAPGPPRHPKTLTWRREPRAGSQLLLPRRSPGPLGPSAALSCLGPGSGRSLGVPGSPTQGRG